MQEPHLEKREKDMNPLNWLSVLLALGSLFVEKASVKNESLNVFLLPLARVCSHLRPAAKTKSIQIAD